MADPAHRVIEGFSTEAEAKAYAAGVELVNDSAISDIEVHEPGWHGDQWSVSMVDSDYDPEPDEPNARY